MDKQQQVLEMAKDICRVKLNCNDVCNPISACDALKYAERAVEAGYIKVVWCKECKHSVKYKCKNDACYNFTICRRRDGYSESVEEDDFCSYGEREGGDHK